MQSLSDGSAINNDDLFHTVQSTVFETPPSALTSSPSSYHPNLLHSPLIRSSRCALCLNDSRSLRSSHLSNCSHRYCDTCVRSVMEHGCPACTEEASRMQLTQLRLSPSEGLELSDNSKGLARLDGRIDSSFSIWGSDSVVWDNSSKSLPIEQCASDPSGLFQPSLSKPSHSPSPPSCASCGDDAKASHFCADCNELLCSTCVDAHLRVRLTREHKVCPLSSRILASPAPGAIPSSMMTPTHGDDSFATVSMSSSLCQIHESKLVVVCEWCKGVPLCSSCFVEHQGHKLTAIGDVRQAMNALLADSRQEEKRMDEGQEAVTRMVERVEASVQAVASELRSVMHLHISALEERKRELLALVETTRVSKMNSLKAQAETLSMQKQRLQSLTKLSESVKGDDDGTKLNATFEKMVQLYAMPRIARQANESDSIKFLHPDPNLITKLRSLGALESGASARQCQILGENYRRAVRDRQMNVTLQLRDACNQICRAKGQQVAATVIAPNGQPLDVGISEREGGLCMLTYTPLMDGQHTLTITVRGVPISGCPTNVEVRRGRNYEEIAVQGELFSFGREGSGDGELCRPWGICCDLLGRILVADRSNNRIQIFDKDGHFITKFGSPGVRAGQFDRPAGITTNTLNQIVVADKDNHRVQVFDQDGNFLIKFGERGRPVGMFNYPWGVACNNQNHIAVSDTRNHRVQIFTSMGQFIRKCGFDSAFFYKHLDSPRGLCYLPDGQLLITDFNNHRLAVLSASRSTPDMKCYGSEGDADGLFCRPQGVKTDGEGHVLVCDSRNNRVQIFSGDDMRFIASFGGTPRANGFQMPQELPQPMAVANNGGGPPNQPPPLFNPNIKQSLLDRPTDVCVSTEGRVYVVDFGNNCIRVF